MEDESFKCPTCGMGELVSEIIDNGSGGGRIVTHYYACGHQQQDVTLPTININHDMVPGLRTRFESGEKSGNQPKYEIDERFAKDDIDKPDEYVENRIFRNRKNSSTVVFHVAQYPSGEIKHIDCKTCGSKYQYNSKDQLEDLFIIDFSSRPKIECLRCHAKFEK
jgi:transcription elongation factor Elf1